MDERRSWIEPLHPSLSIRYQCNMLELNRSSYYYVPKINEMSDDDLELIRLVDEIYTRYPFFWKSSDGQLHNIALLFY